MSLKFEPVKYTAEDIGCMLFESITKGLYARPLHAIREYIQNEVESDPPPTKVEVVLEGRNLSIIGDGGGMNEEEIEEAKKVGFSFKDPEQNFGFRGIGIWSGVSIADKIIVSTKRTGMKKRIILEIDCNGIKKDLDARVRKSLTQMLTEHVRKATLDAPERDHGTHVQLVHILDEVIDHFTEKEVRDYMRQVLPAEFDPRFKFRRQVTREIKRNVPNYRVVNISFNGKPVYRPPRIKDLESPITGMIKQGGRNLAFYWVCLHKERGKIEQKDCRKLVYKQWNFTVGDRQSCLPFIDALGHLADWYTGEIHIIDSEITADSARMSFECSPAFDALQENLLDEMKELQERARRKSHIETLNKAFGDEKNLIAKPKSFKDAGDKLKWLSSAEKLRKSLRGKLAHTWTPATKKPRIKKSLAKLEQAYKERLGAPLKLEAESRKKLAKKARAKIPQLHSFADLIKELELTGLVRVALQTIERVLDKFFADDAEILRRLKLAISKALLTKFAR